MTPGILLASHRLRKAIDEADALYEIYDIASDADGPEYEAWIVADKKKEAALAKLKQEESKLVNIHSQPQYPE